MATAYIQDLRATSRSEMMELQCQKTIFFATKVFGYTGASEDMVLRPSSIETPISRNVSDNTGDSEYMVLRPSSIQKPVSRNISDNNPASAISALTGRKTPMRPTSMTKPDLDDASRTEDLPTSQKGGRLHAIPRTASLMNKGVHRPTLEPSALEEGSLATITSQGRVSDAEAELSILHWKLSAVEAWENYQRIYPGTI